MNFKLTLLHSLWKILNINFYGEAGGSPVVERMTDNPMFKGLYTAASAVTGTGKKLAYLKERIQKSISLVDNQQTEVPIGCLF